MTTADYKKTLEIINEQGKKHTASKETALAFLIKAGFITKSGKPTKAYQ